MAAGATRSSPSRPGPARLLVTATEFRFALSRSVLAAGPALVQLSNRGQDAHDLVVRRLSRTGRQLGGTPVAAPQAVPGAVLERAYRLAPGRYVLFCSLPGHRRAGMQARITVRR
jgi:hypothetical protein